MNPEEQIPMPEGSFDMIDGDDTVSVDDFIRELEAKEKDLQITADLRIEVAEFGSDFAAVPEFVKEDLVSSAPTAPLNNPQVSPPSATKIRNFELENEIAALKVRVLELKAERQDMQEKSDRRLKDFENFKYRVDRERRGSFIDQISKLAAQILPVMDNLDRALDAAARTGDDKGAEYQQFYDGIVLVNQQVNEVVANMGVQPIASVGELFDPNFHEAVAAEESTETPPNTISQEMLRGYRIGNKVIRHSMVKVTTAPIPEKTPSPPAESQDEPASPSDTE
jgi:molecular chaperone GrpE